MTNNSSFSTKILNWFDVHGRHDLPWQHNKTLYRVWVSEIMLQQTQVTTAIPYYEKFMARFPDVAALAKAPQDDVLQHWAGLGYYARARNLHKAAIQIMTEHDGQFPEEHESLVALPGIGRSTAGAILSLTLNQRHPILDGNVKRVLTRFGAIAGWPSNKKVEDVLWQLADKLTPQQRVDDYNQAMMDMGATLCTPRRLGCDYCPWRDSCAAYASGDPSGWPVVEERKPLPFQVIGIGVVINAVGEVLIDQRLEEGLLGGMWEFPGGKQEPGEAIEACVARELMEELGIVVSVGEALITLDHAYSHKNLQFVVHLCDWCSGDPKPLASQQVRWVRPEQLKNYPFPAANARIIDALLGRLNTTGQLERPGSGS